MFMYICFYSYLILFLLPCVAKKLPSFEVPKALLHKLLPMPSVVCLQRQLQVNRFFALSLSLS